MSLPAPKESIGDARQRLAEIADRAEHEGNPTVITQHGREVAAVVPIEFLRQCPIPEEREVLRILNERRATDDGTRYTLEETMAETLARPE